MKIIDFMLYLVFRLAVLPVSILPFRVNAAIGKVLGRIYFIIDGRHRKVIKANMAVVFGSELNDKGRQRLAVKFCENFAMNILDALKMHFRVSPRNMHKFIDIQGKSNLEKSIKRGKGTVLLSAHFGNFLLFRYLCYLDIPGAAAIIRELDNPFFEKFLGSIVRSHNAVAIRPKGAIRRMESLLRANFVTLTLGDQKAGKSSKHGRHGVLVDFFGTPSQTHITAPHLARRTGAEVLPAFVIRKGPGKYRIDICEKLDLPHEGNEKEVLKRGARIINSIFEEYIMRYPWEWFWVHRRWKKAPGLEDLYVSNDPLEVVQGTRLYRQDNPPALITN